LLREGAVSSRDDIREHLSGNFCRCTGYHAIIDAVETTMERRADQKNVEKQT
jgi:carbon-monoxide dehydrogenase small subunit